jgi:hypothetical protein
MKWYRDLFVGQRAGQDTEEIISRAENLDFMRGLYLITLASNGTDQLDLVRASSLIGKPNAVRHLPMIVGIAIGKKEAVEVTMEIARCVYVQDHASDIRSWFQRQEGQV